MVKPKIFLYINLLFKTLVLLQLFITGQIIFIILIIFMDFFSIYSFYFIGLGIPIGILAIILLSSLILWNFIFLCERTSEYQKFKKNYAINFVAEAIWIYLFFNQIIGDLMSGYFESATIWLVLFIMALIASITGIIYFFLKRAEIQGIKPKPDILEKLRDILNVSNKIKLKRVQNILNLDDKSFDGKIIEWANEFGFRIDGEYLIVNKESISEFIEALDDKFIEWEQLEKNRESKV